MRAVLWLPSFFHLSAGNRDRMRTVWQGISNAMAGVENGI